LLSRLQFALVFVAALLAAASTWFYMLGILKPHQVAYAAAHQQPRGNLSDLYPRWLGARELLLRHRNPYSLEITFEIQKGYYGRVLDPSRPDDPKDQQGFAYPAYVVFLLAPTATLPFEVVQTWFRWFLFGITAASVFFWLRLLRWKLAWPGSLLAVVLVLGSLPVAQGIRLQQLSLLVAGILAGCAACLASGYFFCAGGLLALATIKPQLAWPLVIWLLLWATSEWRSRRRFIFGFALVMALLLAGAEILLPGWWRMFLDAIRQYHQYTQNRSVMEVLLGSIAGRICDGLAILVAGFCLWPTRREQVSSARFGRAFALVMALTGVIVPMFAPYNQVLLLPAILLLVQDATASASPWPAMRFIRAAVAAALAWPWVVTLSLSVTRFWMTPERVQSFWQVPFYSTFALPVFVLVFAVLDLLARPADTLPAAT
jgi:hypothetical protein